MRDHRRRTDTAAAVGFIGRLISGLLLALVCFAPLSAMAAPTSTSLSISPSSSTYGEVVTLTATVTSTAGTPNLGGVTFHDGAQVIGATGVYNGVATTQVTTINAGSRSITAHYNGEGNFDDSESAPVVIQVSKAVTTTVVTSSVNPSPVGQYVSLKVTVSNSSGLRPSGTVTFYDGATVIGSKTLSVGAATFSTKALIKGNHPIRVEYFGDSNFFGSVSPVLTQVVKYGVTVAIVRSADPVRPLEPVTFTSTVRSPSGTPTGTVTFLHLNTPLQTVALSAGSASWTTSDLPYGLDFITARYNGAADFVSATSPSTSVLVTYALGDPLKLNTGVAYRQTRPSTAGLADGGAVVVWENQTQIDGPRGIIARRMSVDGQLGPEIVITAPAAGVGSPAVAGLTNGDFVVVWQAGAAGKRSIYMRRYAPNGTPRGVLQRVNIPVTRDNSLARVAPMANGAFIVVWQSANASGTASDIHARRFNGAGVPALAQFLVNTTTAGEQTAPVVTQLANGNSVVAWSSTVSGGYAPFFQLFLPDGHRSGTERRASPEVMSALPRLAASPLAMTTSGAFALAWERPQAATSTPPDVYLQRYTAAGVAAGSTVRLDPVTAGIQADPSLALIAGNHLVTAWSRVAEADSSFGESALVQIFRPNGTRLFVPFSVNWLPNDLERRPSVAAYNGGRNYVVAWSDVIYNEATGDVFIQRFLGPAPSSSSALDTFVSSAFDNQAPSLVSR